MVQYHGSRFKILAENKVYFLCVHDTRSVCRLLIAGYRELIQFDPRIFGAVKQPPAYLKTFPRPAKGYSYSVTLRLRSFLL